MLSKIWKKALLAICIIACLFNVMGKLIGRTSLDIQLKSVADIINLEKKQTENEKLNQKPDSELEKTSENTISEKENTIVVIY